MHPIETIMKNSVEQIKEMVDVNTIVGTPIVLRGETMVLPISKVSLGFMSGGGEYGTPIRQCSTSDSTSDDANRYPFAGAAAAGMSISPVAFLSVNGNSVKVFPVQYDCAMDRVIDVLSPIVSSLSEKLKAKGKCCCD